MHGHTPEHVWALPGALLTGQERCTLPITSTLQAPASLKQIIIMKPPKGGLKCLDLNSISEFTFLSKKVQLIYVGILANLNFMLLIVK